MKRFTDEYVYSLHEFANYIANGLKHLEFVLAVCLDVDNEMVTILIETDDNSNRELVYKGIYKSGIYESSVSSSFVETRVQNLQDYDDFAISYYISEDAEIIYSKVR